MFKKIFDAALCFAVLASVTVAAANPQPVTVVEMEALPITVKSPGMKISLVEMEAVVITAKRPTVLAQK